MANSLPLLLRNGGRNPTPLFLTKPHGLSGLGLMNLFAPSVVDINLGEYVYTPLVREKYMHIVFFTIGIVLM
jgi:hypothetical protein